MWVIYKKYYHTIFLFYIDGGVDNLDTKFGICFELSFIVVEVGNLEIILNYLCW
jgi:hypothetical protein